MDVSPIKTEADLAEALREIERLWDAEPDTPDGDRLDVLVTLVEAYERRNHPMPPPDPVSAITFMLDQRGLTRDDFAKIVGSPHRAEQILMRERPLSLVLVRRISAALAIPAGILIQPYRLTRAA